MNCIIKPISLIKETYFIYINFQIKLNYVIIASLSDIKILINEIGAYSACFYISSIIKRIKLF